MTDGQCKSTLESNVMHSIDAIQYYSEEFKFKSLHDDLVALKTILCKEGRLDDILSTGLLLRLYDDLDDELKMILSVINMDFKESFESHSSNNILMSPSIVKTKQMTIMHLLNKMEKELPACRSTLNFLLALTKIFIIDRYILNSSSYDNHYSDVIFSERESDESTLSIIRHSVMHSDFIIKDDTIFFTNVYKGKTDRCSCKIDKLVETTLSIIKVNSEDLNTDDKSSITSILQDISKVYAGMKPTSNWIKVLFIGLIINSQCESVVTVDNTFLSPYIKRYLKEIKYHTDEKTYFILTFLRNVFSHLNFKISDNNIIIHNKSRDEVISIEQLVQLSNKCQYILSLPFLLFSIYVLIANASPTTINPLLLIPDPALSKECY